jgi:hypothetical protein
MKQLKRITIDWFLVALIFISIALILTNYTPGTFMSGWDTIHPEFNLGLYWKRIMNVWQEHQGLGAPPSQAHAAEIPRMMIYSLLTAILPLNLVRYSFFWLTIILGPVGIYYFILYITKKKHDGRIGAFLGALFYLLNVGTMQHYIVILEMFAVKFAALGFVFLFLTRYLDRHRYRDLLYFVITIIFSTPLAHTATLWYVFYGGLIGYICLYSFFLIQQRLHSPFYYMKKALFVILLIFVLNAYWILPNVYYSLNYGQDVINSKIHRLFSEEAYLNNKQFGNIKDLLLFKNFLFNWYILQPSSQSLTNPLLTYNNKLLQPWIEHLNNPFVITVGLSISILSLFGIALAIRKKNYILLSFLPITVGCAFFLLADTPGIREIFNLLRSANPIFKEMLRFPFTKMSPYFIFGMCILFGYTATWLEEKIIHVSKHSNHEIVRSCYTYLFTFIIIIYALPAFQGHFISSIIRVHIPDEYIEMFKRFGNQDEGRILVLPLNSLYGWSTYLWPYDNKPTTYQGAGFTWFGLNQPTLNREFDRWYYPNEQAYREFFYALYSQNTTLFEQLLEKYNIQSIMLDKNTTLAGGPADLEKLFYTQSQNLISKIPNIYLSYQYGPNITIYTYGPKKDTQPISLLSSYNTVHPPFRWNYIDYSYTTNGNYISVPYDSKKNKPSMESLPHAVTYPGRMILDDKERVNKDMLSIGEQYYTVTFDPHTSTSGIFENSEMSFMENTLPIEVSIKRSSNRNIVQMKYILPYPSGVANQPEEFMLPVDVNQFVIQDTLFDIPLLLSNNSILYLGDVQIQQNVPLTLELLSPQRIYDKVQVNLKKPITFQSPTNPLVLTSAIPSSSEVDVTLEQLTQETKDCGFEKAKKIDKKVLFDERGEGIIRYEALNGTICDTLKFEELSQDTGYILAIESRHVSGLPMRVCLQDVQTKQCILEDELSKFSNFDTDYFIIPPYGHQGGYYISISNMSIGTEETVNETRRMRIIPFPYYWLQSVAYKTNQTAFYQSTENNKILDVSKKSPTSYTAKLNTFATDDTIVLNQAYEKGWQAYVVHNKLAELLPFIFGTRVPQHVLVNNWANGWIVGKENVATDSQAQVAVIYLPQYLFTVGIILFAITSFFLIKPQNILKFLQTVTKV